MTRQEVRLSMTRADRDRLVHVARHLGYRPLQLQSLLLCGAWERLVGDVEAGRVPAGELRALAAFVGAGDDVPADLEAHQPAVIEAGWSSDDGT